MLLSKRWGHIKHKTLCLLLVLLICHTINIPFLVPNYWIMHQEKSNNTDNFDFIFMSMPKTDYAQLYLIKKPPWIKKYLLLLLVRVWLVGVGVLVGEHVENFYLLFWYTFLSLLIHKMCHGIWNLWHEPVGFRSFQGSLYQSDSH